MQNKREGEVHGYKYRRARVCDIMNLTSTAWKWFLFDCEGKHLKSFARYCEMADYAHAMRHKLHKYGPYSSGIDSAEFEGDAVNAISALKGSEL